MNIQTLTVSLAERSYPILVGAGLIDDGRAVARQLGRPRAAVVTNEVVAPLYLDRMRAALAKQGVETFPVVLPDGEAHKDWQTLNRVFDALLGARCERSTTIVALGGGVIGDLAGFAAATYQRGVPFIQVPTTLLAQVDSSVGGKTAINHPLGKNMIGAFYQPKLVLADTETLNTLPDRELAAGIAEIVKYGLIRDASFFDWIEANMPRLLARDPEALGHAILRSCTHKAEVVAADERETGERALLNLGHTFGHAIEAGTGYGTWLHGEAVAAGTVLAAEMSCRMDLIARSTVDRIRRVFASAKLPVSAPGLGADRYLDLMGLDKKVEGGRLRLILLRAIGSAFVTADVPPDTLRSLLASCGSNG